MRIWVVIVGYRFAGSFGTVSLWADPTQLGGSAPTAEVSFLRANTVANLQVVGLEAQSAAAAGNWALNTLHIDTTWADVTPALVPEPSAFVLGALAAFAFAGWRRARP